MYLTSTPSFTLQGRISKTEPISMTAAKPSAIKVVAEIKSGDHAVSPELVMKMQLLSEKLEKHKGKKVYGYLDKNTKS